MGHHPFRTLQGKFTLSLAAADHRHHVCPVLLDYFNAERPAGKGIEREGKALVESLAISCTDTMLYEEVGLVEEGGLLDNYLSELAQRKDLDIQYAMILEAAREGDRPQCSYGGGQPLRGWSDCKSDLPPGRPFSSIPHQCFSTSPRLLPFQPSAGGPSGLGFPWKS